jgi:hypothetical protein
VHPDPDPEHWREQTKDFLRQARDNLIAHNDLSRVALVSGIPTLPHRLDAAETLIALLRAGGMADQVVAYGVDLLALYLVSSAYETSQRTGPDRSVGDERWEFGLDVMLAGLERAADPAQTERRSSEAR